MLNTIIDGVTDCLKDLPFLFAAFLLLEALEHHASDKMNAALGKAGPFGPLVGALLGCVPQCGFSIMASDFFAGGVISLGTLMSVYFATSDEAVVILLSNPGRVGDVGKLIITKVIIALIAGYVIYLAERLYYRRHKKEKSIEKLCERENCACNEEGAGILKPALHHTMEVFIFLLIFTVGLNILLETVGMRTLSGILLKDSVFQPLLASLIGLIPNCAASVMLTELYMEGIISFGSAVAGLCSAAGLGLVVLFRMNRNLKENIGITALLVGIAVLSGIIIQNIL